MKDIANKPIKEYAESDYKLVPITPTYEQLDAIKNCCVALQKAQLSDLEAYGVYKTVLGIIDSQ